jgi:hypothetical protein
MTVEDLIAVAKKKKLRVGNLYEGTDFVWRCGLYRKADQSPTNWASGYGDTPAAAMEMALGIMAVSEFADQFEELLG